MLAILLCGAAAFGGYGWYKNATGSKSAAETKVNTVTTAPAPLSPTQHDTFDVEFSKKLVLYHQLAAQLDDYAKDNATTPEVRAYAAHDSTYNTTQAGAYTAMLDSWGEQYTNLQDFPKVAGSACSGYPVFPGMLPHSDVSAYLQTNAQDVDKQYISLMIKHHNGINQLVKAEGHFINFGELIKQRDAFYAYQDTDMKRLEQLQQSLGISQS